MGTRADFYVGIGEQAEWLGSIAWDGYPDGLSEIWKITTESEWRAAIAAFLKQRNDGTTPEMGWPWPWEDSRTTDYAYAFISNDIVASHFGSAWFDPTQLEPEEPGPKSAVFPNMKSRQQVAWNERSGLLTFTAISPTPEKRRK